MKLIQRALPIAEVSQVHITLAERFLKVLRITSTVAWWEVVRARLGPSFPQYLTKKAPLIYNLYEVLASRLEEEDLNELTMHFSLTPSDHFQEWLWIMQIL